MNRLTSFIDAHTELPEPPETTKWVRHAVALVNAHSYVWDQIISLYGIIPEDSADDILQRQLYDACLSVRDKLREILGRMIEFQDTLTDERYDHATQEAHAGRGPGGHRRNAATVDGIALKDRSRKPRIEVHHEEAIRSKPTTLGEAETGACYQVGSHARTLASAAQRTAREGNGDLSALPEDAGG